MTSDPDGKTTQAAGTRHKALRRALLDRWPDARVVDADLELDGAPLADLALEDGGTLWLVLRRKRLDFAAAGDVRTAFERARRLSLLLLRALGSEAHELRVLLVVRHLVEGGRAALAPALDEGLVLAVRHVLRGAGGKRSLLEVVEGELADSVRPERGPLPVAGLAPDAARFVAALDARLAPLAAELIRRQARLDPELSCEGDEHGLVWLRAEEVLCTLGAGDGGLECRVAGVGVPRLVRTAPELEDWLDYLLAQLFERWPGGPAEPSFEIPRPEHGGGWLSAEEYEAFQD
ncbi:MAG: hypothetical protein H6831_08640 [Planctomycetes bacterium]|nr:hypothetical protein [Planctomycetota bacterium]MCB9904460.1 hypothetical protein [Planctomycetota bacterium]